MRKHTWVEARKQVSGEVVLGCGDDLGEQNGQGSNPIRVAKRLMALAELLGTVEEGAAEALAGVIGASEEKDCDVGPDSTGVTNLLHWLAQCEYLARRLSRTVAQLRESL